jgi:hypothetical protein
MVARLRRARAAAPAPATGRAPVEKEHFMSVSAVLIPADEEQPVRRIAVDGLDDLQQAVGGCIEAIPYHADDAITTYVNEEGKFECEPNPRATRLLGPGLFAGDFVAGDVVVCGFDAATGENADCSEDFEAKLDESHRELRAPDKLGRRERSIDYEWVLNDDGNGTRNLAALSITHHTAGVGILSGRVHGNEFVAVLSNETEQPAACGGVIRSFQLGVGVWLCSEEVSRFSQKRLDAFAEDALARLRGLYAHSDPRVTRYFKIATGAAL